MYFKILPGVRVAIDGDIGFIDHFKTQFVITLNYSAIADPHTLQIAVTHAVFSSMQCVH
jgi:hypothetical protein